MKTHSITSVLSLFALSFILVGCPAIETETTSDSSADIEQLVVSGGTILTMADDQTVINNGALAIEGNPPG